MTPAHAGEQLAESARIVRAIEAHAVLVGRVRERSHREHENVVVDDVARLQVQEAVVRVEACDGIAPPARVEVSSELGDRVATRTAQAKGLEHVEGADGEVVLGGNKRDGEATSG
jgi:hypothetical protein